MSWSLYIWITVTHFTCRYPGDNLITAQRCKSKISGGKTPPLRIISTLCIGYQKLPAEIQSTYCCLWNPAGCNNRFYIDLGRIHSAAQLSLVNYRKSPPPCKLHGIYRWYVFSVANSTLWNFLQRFACPLPPWMLKGDQ